LQWSTADLRATGPIIEVGVDIEEWLEHQLAKGGETGPGPRNVRGLIDTGASNSTISPTLVDELGIRPIDKVLVQTPGGSGYVSRYRVRLYFPPNGFVVKAYALTASLGSSRLHCLIGRDVLAHADFRYEGRFNRFGLEF